MVTLTGTDIPPLFNRLHLRPKQLHVEGDDFLDLLERPRIAIVGSRKLTPYGRGVIQKLTRELARAGVVIISGLALGADSAAHEACLDAGGQTIAVLPAGLDRVYPAAHHNLAKRIVSQGGALVTEFDPGSVPYPSNFLQRNRLIAAAADGVLIPEAAARSGSLNTAAYALNELNIPLMAVPGSITSPLSEGTNNLLKAGAIPVTCIEDIYNALDWTPSVHEQRDIQTNNEAEKTLVELLKQGLADGQELLKRSTLSPQEFNQHLTMLELTGRIRATGGNQWSLA